MLLKASGHRKKVEQLMYPYEVTDTTKGNKNRKYLVVAANSIIAKDMVESTVAGKTPNPTTISLSVRPANEDDVRARKTTVTSSWGGYTHEESCWELYKHCKKRGTAAILADYLF